MRRRTGLLVLALLALAVTAGAGSPSPERPERIGRYELVPVPGGLEIRSAPAPAATPVIVVVGVVLLGGALVLGASGGMRGAALALLVVGLAFLAGAAVLAFDRTRVVASEAGLESEGLLGASRFDAAALGAIEVTPRRITGPETKRSEPPRAWQVSVGVREGGNAARFRLATLGEAEMLATRLAGALGRPTGPGAPR